MCKYKKLGVSGLKEIMDPFMIIEVSPHLKATKCLSFFLSQLLSSSIATVFLLICLLLRSVSYLMVEIVF